MNFAELVLEKTYLAVKRVERKFEWLSLAFHTLAVEIEFDLSQPKLQILVGIQPRPETLFLTELIFLSLCQKGQ